MFIKVTGLSQYEGWIGTLGPIQSSTAAHGNVFEVGIYGPGDEDPTIVMLPEHCIQKLTSRD